MTSVERNERWGGLQAALKRSLIGLANASILFYLMLLRYFRWDSFNTVSSTVRMDFMRSPGVDVVFEDSGQDRE